MMIEDLAGWLHSVAPGLGGYELLAIQLLALGATVVLLVLSLFALARAARLLSDTLAVRVRTEAVENAHTRLSGEFQSLRERYAALMGEANARRPQSGSRKAARPQSAYTRRYGDQRNGPSIH